VLLIRHDFTLTFDHTLLDTFCTVCHATFIRLEYVILSVFSITFLKFLTWCCFKDEAFYLQSRTLSSHLTSLFTFVVVEFGRRHYLEKKTSPGLPQYSTFEAILSLIANNRGQG